MECRDFFRRFAEGVFDEADIRVRAAELANFVKEASGVYGFDASRVTALGFSNGANIGAAMMLLHPESLSGGILLRAMVPLVPTPLPQLAGKRILISAGRMDPMGNAEETAKLRGLFEKSGAAVSVTWQAAGHSLTQKDLVDAQAWLAAKDAT